MWGQQNLSLSSFQKDRWPWGKEFHLMICVHISRWMSLQSDTTWVKQKNPLCLYLHVPRKWSIFHLLTTFAMPSIVLLSVNKMRGHAVVDVLIVLQHVATYRTPWNKSFVVDIITLALEDAAWAAHEIFRVSWWSSMKWVWKKRLCVKDNSWSVLELFRSLGAN